MTHQSCENRRTYGRLLRFTLHELSLKKPASTVRYLIDLMVRTYRLDGSSLEPRAHNCIATSTSYFLTGKVDPYDTRLLVPAFKNNNS